MISVSPILHAQANDPSRSGTPLASKLPQPYITPPDISDTKNMSPSLFMSLGSSDSHSSQFLLPIPLPSSNRSQSSFVFSDVVKNDGGSDPLPPDIASADVSIATDGSFVETSSGPAARELKRRYDQHFGVGISVRSPYAITAFVNQHGKQMYRVGRRELSAPAAAAAEVEQQLSSPSKSPFEFRSINESSRSRYEQPPRSKRRSRMSMHAFLPPSIFKAGGSSSKQETESSHTAGPRKLRKTRSIPDMFGTDASSLGATHAQQETTSTITGRPYSHSVTAADIPSSSFTDVEAPYPVPPAPDIFAEVMGWHLPSSATTNHSSQSFVLPGEEKSNKSSTIIPHPFGSGVSFDSPSRRPNAEYLPSPRLLREVQSFESGLTARQVDPQSSTSGRASEVPSLASSIGSDRPPSAIRLRTSTSSISPNEQAFKPSPETSVHSRYSTDVFDVLQTYRGLPLLDKLSLESETTVIKMSLSADETAAPRDDPRFVIWGEIQIEQDLDDVSISQGSFTELSSSHSSSLSRKKGSRASKAPEVPILRLSPGEGTQKVIVAATIERWIAQLTSDLNYDELLVFFLTYRTYITAVDLCHLLICRFHWALQQPSSSHDEIVRRIVRVRTFVAIRYWLLTFFIVDFIPDRELRLLLANWLNALIRDPILEKHKDGLSIVRKLIKVVKDCKKAHTRSASKPKPRKQTQPKQEKQEHVLGEKFAEATRKPDLDDDDSDLDLDFLPEESAPSTFQNDPVNAHLTAAHVGAGLGPTRPKSIPLSLMATLQPIDRNSGPGSNSGLPIVQTSATLPIHHNALSRVFVNTFGRLGRWKRVLNSRTAGRTPLGACADVSAFDLELAMSGDLLSVHGGVEQYLKMIEPKAPSSTSDLPLLDISREAVAATLSSPPIPRDDEPPLDHTDVSHEVLASREEPNPPLGSVTEARVRELSPAVPVDVESSDRPDSFQSSSTDSLGEPLTSGMTFPPPDEKPWQFEVVSIDELDLSDTSSDDQIGDFPAPPGLRKGPRRLPLRRDFEFLRRSEAVSSMGLTSRDSGQSSSAVSLAAGLCGNVLPWQMNALMDSLSNDDESGDVEAALRRLEGQINPQKQQEKISKVDGWVRTIQERMAVGDYGDENLRFADDEDEYEDEDETTNFGDDDDVRSVSQNEDSVLVVPSNPLAASSQRTELSDDKNDALELAGTPVPTHTSYKIASPPQSNSSTAPKPAVDDVPPGKQRKSVLNRLSTSSPKRLSLSTRFGNQEAPRMHRSFILGQRAEILAEHFSMIDRELFISVKFEELVSNDWKAYEEVNVLDWAQYVKDRALWKSESRWPDKTSALAALRARFNLIASFTLSEIVLTQPSQRAFLVGKFIRIAWKAFDMNNFNTVVAIITGLQSDWVNKAMRRSWSRIGVWETRMFNDLKAFSSNVDDFRHVRKAIEEVADSKPFDGTSVASGGTDGQSGKNKSTSENKPSSCVPFIGVYLSQLHRYSRLPDLIDPTAPNEAVSVDPITSNFDAPAHPEVFSTLAPLPSSMHLEPLINVHKQRMIAGVIKSLVAGQHLASRVQFSVDKKLFQKCFRLRGLDSDALERALAIHNSVHLG